MTQTEEIRLHNLFIKFKNEHKTLTEIEALLGNIDRKLIENWDIALELEKNKVELHKLANVIGVNSDSKYRYNHSVNLPMSDLEMVKFELKQLISQNIDTEWAMAAKKYLPIFKNYFTDFSIDVDIDNKKCAAKFNLNTNDSAIIKKAEEAVNFYSTYYGGKTLFEEAFLLKETTPDTFGIATDISPYSLKTLKVKKFEGIIETGFEGVPIDTKWLFFIGENSYGKTTLLKSIAIGFIGKDDEDVELFKPYIDNGIGIEYFCHNRSKIHNIGNSFKPFNHLACYGPSRLQIQTDQTQNDVAKKSTTTYSLFNSDGILLNIEYELLIWYLEKSPKFDVVKNAILKLIPYLADIQIDQPNRKILYIEKEPIEDIASYKPVNFEQLASGFRSIIAMVGDMMIRLFKSQPNVVEPSELAGIVIIDELDLHWHPKMQREIPKLLSAIFPKVQFIASTHSLVPLLGAPENSVLLKVNRTMEEGITVERVDIDFQALSSDTMLRDIFDLEKYMSDQKIVAWERYIELKGMIYFENDEAKKLSLIDERERLGDKYNFGV